VKRKEKTYGNKVKRKTEGKVPEGIRPALQKELGLNNLMAVPRLEKIVLNMGLGEATQNVKIMDRWSLIWPPSPAKSQSPPKAKKSIAAFKVREGMPIGAMVTLRGDIMYEFLDRLISCRPPPRARLQGRFHQELRRARQLHAGHAPPADFP